MRSEGDDVVCIQERSRDFFQSTIKSILPEINFDDANSFTSNCVTTKSDGGKVFNGSISSDDAYASFGCNGSGAAQANRWGEKLALASLGRVDIDAVNAARGGLKILGVGIFQTFRSYRLDR